MFSPYHLTNPRRIVLALTVLAALLVSVPGLAKLYRANVTAHGQQKGGGRTVAQTLSKQALALTGPNQFGARISRSNAFTPPNLQVTDNLPLGLNIALANVDTPINYTGSVPPAFTGSFDAGDSTYNRPVSCAALSGVGTAVAYDTITITNNSAGTANFVVTSSLIGGGACGDNNDTYFTLYNGAFNPASALTNCVAVNDDISGATNRCSTLSFSIPVGETRVMAVASFNNLNTATGAFSYQINFTGTTGGAAVADLAITKTDGVATATPGGSTTYTITASNATATPATGATVADTFPAILSCTWTCVGAGGGTCTASGSGNINNTVNLPAGASVTYTATCAISASATGTLSNTATVTIAGDPNAANNSATDTDTLSPSADLAITKTDGVTSATPGGSVTYTITASNAGPSNATGATVADTFPAPLTCNWTCVGAGGGTCTASGSGNINNTVNLPSGGSVTYTASCTISAAATGTLSNTATVAAPGGVTDPTPGNNSATDSDTLSASADLAITKTDGVTTVTAGGSTTYTITASNAGPSNASGATVADTFPASLTCTWMCVGAGGGTCTASGLGNINNTVNLPSGGSVTYTAACSISAATTGTLSNTATVTAPGGVTDPTLGNNSATDSDALICGTPVVTSYTGPPVAIPDAFAAVAVFATLPVSGLTSPIGKVTFSFDGTSCNTTPASTTVGLDHTFVGDLQISLISPGGTTVALTNNRGGAGINFCNTVFDDAAGTSITAITAAQNPFIGSFRPEQALSAFNGETANGNWMLKVRDTSGGDVGSIRAFSIRIFPTVCCVTPTAFTVTGGGSFCAGGAGVPVGLSGSQTGVNYQLQRNSVNTGAPVPGTGAALSFGNQTTAGTYTVVATDATMSCTAMMTGSASVAVNPVPSVINPPIATGTVGLPFSQSFTQSGSMASVLFSLNSGTLPTGLALAPNGTLSGTPMQSGTFPLTVKAADTNGCMGVGALYTLVINCPVITVNPSGPALPAGTAGTAYSQVFTQTGAFGNSASWSISAGALPNGLTLNASSGLLSGIPTQTGTFNFTVKAADSFSCMGTQAVSLTINCQTYTINPASLPNGQAGVAYSQTLSTTGSLGTVTYSVNSGTLPPGLTLNGATGALTGTPTTLGSSTFEIKATDGNGCLALKSYTVNITCPTYALSALPAATAGTAYTQTLSLTPNIGGPFSFAVTGGALPAGLSLTLGTGVVSGTPTTAGTFSFTITATGSGAFAACSGSTNYSLQVACPAITLTASLPGGVQGAAYNQSVTASPAGGNYTYAVTTNVLPPGLSLNSATGAITGTPSAAGNYTFTITATGFASGQGSCTGSQAYNVLITATCGTVTVNPASLPAGTLGVAYSQPITPTSGTAPYTFTVTSGSLPAGLTLTTDAGGATATLSGTPTAATTAVFTIKATGQGGCSGSRTYVLTIACGTITLNPATLPNGTMGAAYSQTLTASPSGPVYTYSVSLGSLPPGYNLNTATGVLSGTASTTGTYTFTIKAAVGGCNGSRQYTVTINPAPAAAPLDFDGDRRSEFVRWVVEDGALIWEITRSSDGLTQRTRWGAANALPVAADYDGDGKADLAVFDAGAWLIQLSASGKTRTEEFGASGNVTVPGDYDGDGKADLAVYHGGNWIWQSSREGVTQTFGLGDVDSVPVPADYDGDGRTDMAVFRADNWLVQLSAEGRQYGLQLGRKGDVPLAGDFDGDGKAEPAVWRAAEGALYLSGAVSGVAPEQAFVRLGREQPISQLQLGDYDGAGRVELAVWQASDVIWRIVKSNRQ